MKLKKEAYEKIAKAVNAVSQTKRNGHDIRKKKECWFSIVKKKVLKLFPCVVCLLHEMKMCAVYLYYVHLCILFLNLHDQGSGISS